MSNDPEEPDAVGARTHVVGASASIDSRALDDTAKKISVLTSAVAALNAAIAKVGPGFTTATASMSKFSQATGNVAGMVGNIGSSMFGGANEKGWVRDFMMFPTRFMRGNIQENRQLALTASGALGPQAFGAGATTQSMMRGMTGFMQSANVPTGILGGSPGEMLDLMNIMSRVGAGVDWRSQYGAGYGPPGLANQPRAAGFMRGIGEMQRMNPGAQVGQLAMTLAQQGNIGAQQQAAFLTGGAFAMIGAGGRQKSVSEWAEGVLKWLVNLRPGRERGKQFSYGELMSQNFPGSNIDAWLTANGITEDMKQYFWSYAMAKSNAVAGSTPDQIFAKSEAVNQSVAFQRLQATSAQTRTGFQLAGTMAGTYANKEQANRWMAELMGHMMNEILPAAMSSGVLSYMQYLPDTVEEMIMQLAERTNLGTLGAGVAGWGSAFPGLLGAGDVGDVGDVGDFGSYGASSTAGLHPDMRKRVDSMMAANRNLRVTSGYRDLGKQQQLKRRGVGRVSGRPSAHTRGMAADLGPRSQYPWIMANARKFGLTSGARQGEPWHVGMGDIGDPISDALGGGGALALPGLIKQGEAALDMGIMDTITSIFSGLFKGITSPLGGPEQQIRGISGGISGLMKGIMGIFARGEVDAERLKFRDVYSLMVDEANQATGMPSGIAPTGSWWRNLLNRSRGAAGAAGGAAGGAMGGSGGSFGSKTSPSAATDRAIAATRIASRYWQGTALEQAVAIAGRESTWSPWAHRTDKPEYLLSGDRGMYQINYSNDPTLIAAGIYTDKKQLFDAETNTKAAYHLYQRAGNSFSPWSMGAGGWTAGGDPMHGAKINEARAAISAAGLGDVESYMGGYGGVSGPPVRIAPMNFFNNFTIQGAGGGNGTGGVDMRRTVQVLADQLEGEMKRRVARSN